MSSTQENLEKELTHIKTALHHCQFPSWALNQWEHKFNQPQPPAAPANSSNNNNNSSNSNKYKATIVVPYINKTAEKFKRLCKSRGIQVHFKGTNTLRTALGNPKDKDPKTNQTGIIYKYQCAHIHCNSSYIGESGRSLGERAKENFKAPSPIHHHSTTTGHPMDPNQFNIVHKEVNSQSRTIKEAMFICVQDPPRQELGQVPATAHMGPPSTSLIHIPTQANSTTNYQHITILLVPSPFPSSHYPFRWGAHFSLLFPKVSKCIHLKHLPLLIYNRSTTAPSW